MSNTPFTSGHQISEDYTANRSEGKPMSNDTVLTVRGNQIDPGIREWAWVQLLALDAQGNETVIASVIAAGVDGQGYNEFKEYWHGHDGAATALSNATELKIEHKGSYDWDDYGAEWPTDSSRHDASLEADVNVSYSIARTGPSSLFDGDHAAGSCDVRFQITFDANDNITEVFWAHNNSVTIYLIDESTTTTLTKKTSPSWPVGWKSVTCN